MCELIVGGDSNCLILPEDIPEGFHIFPKTKDDITTMKKRTWLQPQVNKAEELAATCRDYIISTLPIEESKIVTIKGAKSSQVKYIPNHEHPCDHFVISSKITIYK